MLATALTDNSNIVNLQTRQFSGTILRNMLKNHIMKLKNISLDELNQVKSIVFNFL